MSKVACKDCGVKILAATAERTGGYCMPCKFDRDSDFADEVESRKRSGSSKPSSWSTREVFKLLVFGIIALLAAFVWKAGVIVGVGAMDSPFS
ncbi:MAG: hypothetical protein CMO80_17800 [Verrucomicrobiales bacterium]|nr:hypothetical protein [Verrucomicrobiales bacterium]|tara:strand:+ start:1492 stop:1770 length:279 start_codon:yes stop_codon:yes gene_type:complete